MKKNRYTLWLILILILIAFGVMLKIFVFKGESSINQDTHNSISDENVVQDSVNVDNTIWDNIPSNWETHTNSELGFTFQYPPTWDYKGKDTEVVNLSGTITAIEIYFADTISKTTFLMVYHFSPNGSELYRYAVSQYESSQGWYAKGGKQIEVAGNKAIEAFTTISIDGKGNALNPPLRLIIINFLDKQQTGEIRLQFKTPLPDDSTEVAKLRQLLSTFKFSH